MDEKKRLGNTELDEKRQREMIQQNELVKIIINGDKFNFVLRRRKGRR